MTNEFNPEAAAQKLVDSSAISNTTVQANEREAIKIGALIDIAASLRIIAVGLYDERFEPAPEPTLPPAAPLDADEPITIDAPLEVGDSVRHTDGTETGTIVAMGESEGSTWADVDEGDGIIVRLWVEVLERLPEPEPGVELDEDDDDIDADFVNVDELKVKPGKAKGKVHLIAPHDGRTYEHVMTVCGKIAGPLVITSIAKDVTCKTCKGAPTDG